MASMASCWLAGESTGFYIQKLDVSTREKHVSTSIKWWIFEPLLITVAATYDFSWWDSWDLNRRDDHPTGPRAMWKRRLSFWQWHVLPMTDPCMPYMVTFTINIPQMLAYIPYMDPMGYGYGPWIPYDSMADSMDHTAYSRWLPHLEWCFDVRNV